MYVGKISFAFVILVGIIFFINYQSAEGHQINNNNPKWVTDWVKITVSNANANDGTLVAKLQLKHPAHPHWAKKMWNDSIKVPASSSVTVTSEDHADVAGTPECDKNTAFGLKLKIWYLDANGKPKKLTTPKGKLDTNNPSAQVAKGGYTIKMEKISRESTLACGILPAAGIHINSTFGVDVYNNFTKTDKKIKVGGKTLSYLIHPTDETLLASLDSINQKISFTLSKSEKQRTLIVNIPMDLVSMIAKDSQGQFKVFSDGKQIEYEEGFSDYIQRELELAINPGAKQITIEAVDKKPTKEMPVELLPRPLHQLNNKIMPLDVMCNEGKVLMVRPSLNDIACVNPSTAMMLSDLNWFEKDWFDGKLELTPIRNG